MTLDQTKGEGTHGLQFAQLSNLFHVGLYIHVWFLTNTPIQSSSQSVEWMLCPWKTETLTSNQGRTTVNELGKKPNPVLSWCRHWDVQSLSNCWPWLPMQDYSMAWEAKSPKPGLSLSQASSLMHAFAHLFWTLTNIGFEALLSSWDYFWPEIIIRMIITSQDCSVPPKTGIHAIRAIITMTLSSVGKLERQTQSSLNRREQLHSSCPLHPAQSWWADRLWLVWFR